MHSTITGGPPNFACTTDPLDDLDRLLSNSAEFTEFLTAPTLPSIQSQRKALQGSIDNCVGRASNIQQDAAPDGRKQRALDKSREAQKRFRQRQKVCGCSCKPIRLQLARVARNVPNKLCSRRRGWTRSSRSLMKPPSSFAISECSSSSCRLATFCLRRWLSSAKTKQPTTTWLGRSEIKADGVVLNGHASLCMVNNFWLGSCCSQSASAGADRTCNPEQHFPWLCRASRLCWTLAAGTLKKRRRGSH